MTVENNKIYQNFLEKELTVSNLQGEELELCELREYAQKVFLRDNHTRYHKYCKEWLENLTPNQLEGIKVWKYFEESGNLKNNIKK